MINYNNIISSINYYKGCGFTQINAPWIVPSYILDITKPVQSNSILLQDKKQGLVASGEQSFLFMIASGELPRGRYQTVTPCFRDDNVDQIHQKWFLKNELIETDIVNEYELEKVTGLALNFFRKYLPNTEAVVTDIGFDIEYMGIELGSYGIREHLGYRWIYATGCAEPRLSILIGE